MSSGFGLLGVVAIVGVALIVGIVLFAVLRGSGGDQP